MEYIDNEVINFVLYGSAPVQVCGPLVLITCGTDLALDPGTQTHGCDSMELATDVEAVPCVPISGCILIVLTTGDKDVARDSFVPVQGCGSAVLTTDPGVRVVPCVLMQFCCPTAVVTGGTDIITAPDIPVHDCPVLEPLKITELEDPAQ